MVATTLGTPSASALLAALAHRGAHGGSSSASVVLDAAYEIIGTTGNSAATGEWRSRIRSGRNQFACAATCSTISLPETSRRKTFLRRTLQPHIPIGVPIRSSG